MDKIQISIDGGATWQEFEGGCHEFNAEITPEALAFASLQDSTFEAKLTAYFCATRHQWHCVQRQMARERRAARLASWCAKP